MSQSTESRSTFIPELYLPLPSIKEESIYHELSSSDEEGYGPSLNGSTPNLTPTKSRSRPNLVKDDLDMDHGFSSEDELPDYQHAGELDPCDPRYYLDPDLPGFNLDFSQCFDSDNNTKEKKRTLAANAFDVEELYVEQTTPIKKWQTSEKERNFSHIDLINFWENKVEPQNSTLSTVPDHPEQTNEFVEDTNMSRTFKDIQKKHITEFWSSSDRHSSVNMEFSDNTLQYAKPLLGNALAVEVYEETNEGSDDDDDDIDAYLKECGLISFSKEAPLDENQNHMPISANCPQSNQLSVGTNGNVEVFSQRSSSCDSLDNHVEDILNQTIEKGKFKDFKHADDEIDDIIAVNKINDDVTDADLSIDNEMNDALNPRIDSQTFDLSYMDDFYSEMFYSADEIEMENNVNENKLQVRGKLRRNSYGALGMEQSKQSQYNIAPCNSASNVSEKAGGEIKNAEKQPTEENKVEKFSILEDASAVFDEAVAVVMDFFIGSVKFSK